MKSYLKILSFLTLSFILGCNSNTGLDTKNAKLNIKINIPQNKAEYYNSYNLIACGIGYDLSESICSKKTNLPSGLANITLTIPGEGYRYIDILLEGNYNNQTHPLYYAIKRIYLKEGANENITITLDPTFSEDEKTFYDFSISYVFSNLLASSLPKNFAIYTFNNISNPYIAYKDSNFYVLTENGSSISDDNLNIKPILNWTLNKFPKLGFIFTTTPLFKFYSFANFYKTFSNKFFIFNGFILPLGKENNQYLSGLNKYIYKLSSISFPYGYNNGTSIIFDNLMSSDYVREKLNPDYALNWPYFNENENLTLILPIETTLTYTEKIAYFLQNYTLSYQGVSLALSELHIGQNDTKIITPLKGSISISPIFNGYIPTYIYVYPENATYPYTLYTFNKYFDGNFNITSNIDEIDFVYKHNFFDSNTNTLKLLSFRKVAYPEKALTFSYKELYLPSDKNLFALYIVELQNKKDPFDYYSFTELYNHNLNKKVYTLRLINPNGKLNLSTLSYKLSSLADKVYAYALDSNGIFHIVDITNTNSLNLKNITITLNQQVFDNKTNLEFILNSPDINLSTCNIYIEKYKKQPNPLLEQPENYMPLLVLKGLPSDNLFIPHITLEDNTLLTLECKNEDGSYAILKSYLAENNKLIPLYNFDTTQFTQGNVNTLGLINTLGKILSFENVSAQFIFVKESYPNSTLYKVRYPSFSLINTYNPIYDYFKFFKEIGKKDIYFVNPSLEKTYKLSLTYVNLGKQYMFYSGEGDVYLNLEDFTTFNPNANYILFAYPDKNLNGDINVSTYNITSTTTGYYFPGSILENITRYIDSNGNTYTYIVAFNYDSDNLTKLYYKIYKIFFTTSTSETSVDNTPIRDVTYDGILSFIQNNDGNTVYIKDKEKAYNLTSSITCTFEALKDSNGNIYGFRLYSCSDSNFEVNATIEKDSLGYYVPMDEGKAYITLAQNDILCLPMGCAYSPTYTLPNSITLDTYIPNKYWNVYEIYAYNNQTYIENSGCYYLNSTTSKFILPSYLEDIEVFTYNLGDGFINYTPIINTNFYNYTDIYPTIDYFIFANDTKAISFWHNTKNIDAAMPIYVLTDRLSCKDANTPIAVDYLTGLKFTIPTVNETSVKNFINTYSASYVTFIPYGVTCSMLPKLDSNGNTIGIILGECTDSNWNDPTGAILNCTTKNHCYFEESDGTKDYITYTNITSRFLCLGTTCITKDVVPISNITLVNSIINKYWIVTSRFEDDESFTNLGCYLYSDDGNLYLVNSYNQSDWIKVGSYVIDTDGTISYNNTLGLLKTTFYYIDPEKLYFVNTYSDNGLIKNVGEFAVYTDNLDLCISATKRRTK